jgi:multidrug resistance efflux pump
MERFAGPFMGVAFIAVLGLAIYSYMLREDLAKAKAAVVAVEQNRDSFKQKLDDLGKTNAARGAALDTCNAQLKDAQAQLEAASKKPARRR